MIGDARMNQVNVITINRLYMNDQTAVRILRPNVAKAMAADRTANNAASESVISTLDNIATMPKATLVTNQTLADASAETENKLLTNCVRDTGSSISLPIRGRRRAINSPPK